MVLESNELNLLWVKDGVNSYTWVKYSKIYPPTAQSITDSSTDAIYIGIAYNKTTIQESNDPGDYSWTKIKGESGEDAYTVMMSNENITFNTDVNNMALDTQTYVNKVLVYKGATQITNFTIGAIASPSGLTVSSDNTYKNVYVTSTKSRYIANDYGAISVPITVDGITFTRQISYIVSRNSTGTPNAYTWVMYATSRTPLPSDISSNPANKTYVGIGSNKRTQTPSTQYQEYQWFPLPERGVGIGDITQLYYPSVYTDPSLVPAPTDTRRGIKVKQGIINTAQGLLMFDKWDINKPEYESGQHLWTSLQIATSDGGYIYTDPALSDQWEDIQGTNQIGGTQLIRNTKTLIDERIQWIQI